MRRAAALLCAAAAFLGLLLADRLGLPLGPEQRRVAAVTALTAILWLTSAAPLWLASLLPLALFPALGVLDLRGALASYHRDLIQLFLGAFVVALGLERWGVHRRMAQAVVARIGSSRRLLVLGFMGASAFLSMWINNTATTLMMIPIVIAVLEQGRGSPSNERFGWCLLLGVAYAASVGGMATPVGTAPNQVFLGQFETLFPEGPKLTFADWIVGFGPFTVLFVPLCWLILTRVVYPFPDPADEARAAREAVRAERRAAGPMTRPQRRMAWAFAITALLWVLRADLDLGGVVVPGWTRLIYGADAADPAWYAVHKNDISDAMVALAMAAFLLVCPSGGGPDEPRRLMDLRAARDLPWGVLLLLGGGFCIAAAFKASGLDRTIGEGLAPWLEGRPRWMVVAAVALLISLLTEVTSNTATTAVLLPVMAAAATLAGQHPMAVMLPATLAASAAFVMPVATPPNAVVFATGELPMSRMARAGVVLNLAAVLLITVVFELWSARWLGIEGLPGWAR